MTSGRRPRRLLSTLAAGAVLVAVSGCASQGTPGDTPYQDEPVPSTEVVGQGTVLQIDGEAPQFCLGAVMESYPPQCSGPELTGWDWGAVGGEEAASGVTWGTYAVWGDWDGAALAVTDSVMLALYDPMPFDDPYLDPDHAGVTSEATLLAIQESIHLEAPVEVLTSSPENGYLLVTVVYDSGSVQEWADVAYGRDLVIIRSALRSVG